MAFHSCGNSRLTAGDTAADHKDLFRALDRAQIIFIFHSRKGIYQTTDTVSFSVFPGAALKTADTADHLIGPPFLYFIRHIRICQRRPGHGYQICFPGFQNAFCNFHIIDPSHGDHRDLYCLFDLGSILHIACSWKYCRRDNGMGRSIDSLGTVDTVCPCFFHQSGDHLRLFDLKASRHILYCGHTV